MHRNTLFLGVLTLIFFTALWFITQAGYELYTYFSLTETARPDSINWVVEKKREDHYSILGEYSFPVNGEVFSGTSSLKRVRFYNAWGAKQRIETLKNKPLKVYYSPKNPKVSTLFRSYPYREVFYAFIMIGLTLYFIGLGYYVGKHQKR